MGTSDQGPGKGRREPDAPVSTRGPLRVVDEANASAEPPAFDENGGDYNIKILQPLFGYIRSKLDEDTLADIVHDCGLPREVIERQTGWISHERLEHFFAAAREIVGSDEEFMRACVYEFKKLYGPFLLIMRSMSVRGLVELATRTTPMICRVGRYEIARSTRTSTLLHYYTDRHESRLVCLSRQAAIRNTPTLFLGMPPAKLVEHSCVAHGDERCEYEMSWYEPLRLRLVGAGALIGLLVALGLPEGVAEPFLSLSSLSLLGGMTGALLEMRRLLHEQRRFADETTLEMEKIIVSHAQATDELASLQQRERDWNRHVEEGVAARTRKLNAVVERLQAVIRQRSGSFPVASKASTNDDGSEASASSLASHAGRSPSMETAVDRVSRLVGELVSIAGDDATKRDLKPESVSVDVLVDQIRRQLKATMVGRNVRITVFQTREAPPSITTLRPILERVIDNLLFNASRHTDRGSVVVEASGTPGSLLLKLSDTGSGISKERLEQVFDNEGGASGRLSNDRSGLAYAARLLDHIGGRLEIMSEPGVGTTLWVYIPVEPPVESSDSPSQDGDAPSTDEPHAAQSSVVGRVVRIRSKLSPAAEP
ncbi:sensor histidine kinase [Paraliomyxa miuraensis]|uniref:sensor histidine kinase n=1 Tax=Paraliomyxa miuraensis TaxID=376150 RepID=UPI00224F7622|nr:HAMP domain-containing sensor histidine kinase [Paraliomyxa miuraensis]MCX4243024.1 HAMP domain-containing histidine kinase [Paraliomyxa miuraensis]